MMRSSRPCHSPHKAIMGYLVSRSEFLLFEPYFGDFWDPGVMFAAPGRRPLWSVSPHASGVWGHISDWLASCHQEVMNDLPLLQTTWGIFMCEKLRKLLHGSWASTWGLRFPAVGICMTLTGHELKTRAGITGAISWGFILNTSLPVCSPFSVFAVSEGTFGYCFTTQDLSLPKVHNH